MSCIDLLLSFCDLDDGSVALVNGKAGKYIPVPQKCLPDLPPPRKVSLSGLTCKKMWMNEHN